MIGPDILHGLRVLRNNRAFTLTVVFSLALGIGANTAIFSLIHALLLRQLPVREPQQLVQLQIVEAGLPTDNLSYPVIQALAAEDELFAGVGGFSGWTFNSGRPESFERLRGVFVTGEYYQMLGVRPVLGRLLTPEDDRPGAAPATVITHDHWMRNYGGDPSIVGRSLPVDGASVVIIGVSEPGFSGTSIGEAMDFTLALSALPQMYPGGERRLDADVGWIRVLARLAPGVTIEQANARLALLWPPLAETTLMASMADEKRRAVLASKLTAIFGGTGWSNLRATFQQPLYVLLAMVGLVLLIACANAANLFLARAETRASEIAMRRALGASRSRIVRQLLTESLLLSLLAAIAGSALAYVGSQALVAWISMGRQLPIVLDLRPDPTVLAFTIGLAVLTGILFGLLPALRATSVTLSEPLKSSSRTAGARSRLGSLLVIAQIALSLTLLIGACLFVGAFTKLYRLNPGYRHQNVLMMGIEGRRAGYQAGQLPRVYEDLLADLRALPGVASATLSSDTPLTGRLLSYPVVLDGNPSSGGGAARFNQVGPDYFQTLGTRLIVGRDFTLRDDAEAPLAAIVNEAFVRRYLEDKNPIGRLVSVPGRAEWQGMAIVGVVEDTLTRGLREPPPPGVYLPYFQHPSMMSSATFSVAIAGPLADVAAQMRQAASRRLVSLFPQVQPFTELVERSLAQERLLANLAGAFGVLALLLAVGGLYGLLTYTTALRQREFGVRMALGATSRNVLALVLSEVGRMMTVGVILGLAIAWIAAKSISSLMFGFTLSDSVMIVVALALLAAAGLAAGSIPAYRAARADPTRALKDE